MRRLLLASSVVAALLALSGRAGRSTSGGGGTIRGRVELRHVPTAPERRPTVAELGTPPPLDATDYLKSVVYLETAPRSAFDQAARRHAVMDQRNETFVPHLLAITTGTTVDFPNSDQI